MSGTEVATLIRKRDAFTRMGDRAMVAEIDLELARHNIHVVDEEDPDVPARYETAVPTPKAHRGRRAARTNR